MAHRTGSAVVLAPALFAVSVGFAAAALASLPEAVPQASQGRAGPAAAALARIAALSGDCEGSFEWTGGRTSRGAMAATSRPGTDPPSWRT